VEETNITGGATMWARQTIESEIFYYKPAIWFKIWFYIVNRVNYKDTKLFERGEGLITYKEIMAKTSATKKQVEGCMAFLKERDMIGDYRTTRGRVRKVQNYAKFQDIGNYKVKPKETKEETCGRPGGGADSIRKEKKEKNKEKVYKKKFGDYVQLTESEHTKLTEEYGFAKIESIIEDVNNYAPNRKVPYKNYSSAIRTFLKNDKAEKIVPHDFTGMHPNEAVDFVLKNPQYESALKEWNRTAHQLLEMAKEMC